MFFTSVVIALFTGPILAGSTGVFAGFSLPDKKWAVGVSTLASFFGLYLMVTIAIMIIVAGAGGALGRGDNTSEAGNS